MIEGPGVSHGRRSVLVIDDEDSVAGLIEEVLVPRGYQVTKSRGGEAALDLAASGGFGLILSDFAIPGMNGLEFAKNLLPKSPQMRIIIISAWLDDDARTQLAVAPNVIGWLRKPFDVLDLGRQVDTHFADPSKNRRSGPPSDGDAAAGAGG